MAVFIDITVDRREMIMMDYKTKIHELLNQISNEMSNEMSNYFFDVTVLSIFIKRSKEILTIVEEMDNKLTIINDGRNEARFPHKYIDRMDDVRNGCPNCYQKHKQKQILYAGQKFCSSCGQKIKYVND